ncbi:TIGR02147 family protein [Bdellovibrio sp. ZAP7]|uniref:TIGR02147 family protein n=1 Tax=Bdellovibrio sp. ZAP7 TaxID=2231053 RepID=UPI00143DB3BC|nr:TIGR02147 family protein [Bdellovibrio sp. ZAP7]
MKYIKPQVFDYLDAYQYLQDYYAFRKKVDVGFSYEAWAAELNFNSRSFLRMMIHGKKKLTEKIVASLAEISFLTPDERDYFFCLVKYTQTSTLKEKQIFGQKLIQILKRQSSAQVLAESEDFISNPLLPRLLSLFSYDDVEKSSVSFAQILGIREEQVIQALEILHKLALIEQPQKGVWISKVVAFKVPDNKGSLNLRKFHEKSLAEALKAFDLPQEVRRYKSLLLPMTTEDYHTFNQLLDDFAKEQMVRHNPKTYSGRRLFQVNFNIYPVSEDLTTTESFRP